MGVFLVTGAARGIGRAVVEQLAGDHDVIALGRTDGSLAALPVRRRLVADLSDPAALAGVLSPVLADLDRLDGVVHSAGVARRGALGDSTVADWMSQLTLNVVAVAELTRLLLPALRAARATVVFVNSGQGLRAAGSSAVYASSKWALRGLAESVREAEPTLRVGTVFPGRVATDMQRDLRAQEGGAYEPGSYLQPATVAAAIVSMLTAPADAVVTDVVLRPARA